MLNMLMIIYIVISFLFLLCYPFLTHINVFLKNSLTLHNNFNILHIKISIKHKKSLSTSKLSEILFYLKTSVKIDSGVLIQFT